MTQASISFSLVLKWLVSICTFICHFFLSNFVEPYLVCGQVCTLIMSLCTLCLCLDMSMLAYIIIYP
jgi:hypothetical protein